jgi:mRNA interferase MazF
MNEGDVILTPIPQADGNIKNRPAIFLREMPPFKDAFVCGISTQTHLLTPGFDELITSQDNDYIQSGVNTWSGKSEIVILR